MKRATEEELAREPTPRAATMPHRRVMREWLAPVSRPSTPRALWLVAVDLLLYAAGMAATVLAPHPLLQLAAALATGFVIGRLFILGHDACHQSFTAHRRLNRWLGRLLFLPSLTPYSLWEVGHNVVHHGYTNLKGFDFIWAPMTPAEYRALPAWRRGLERFYRSGWGPGLYYGLEIWWKRMLFPTARHMPTRRRIFTLDGLLVSAYAVLWAGALVWSARATGQSVAGLLALGFGVPFVFWNCMMGFVVYVHHTHENVEWHDDKKAWSATHPFVSTTVHLTFRSAMGGALHHIMEHTAHHVDMGIPLYRLKAAQSLLEERMPGRIVVQPFSWRWYWRTARICKLYESADKRWRPFSQ